MFFTILMWYFIGVIIAFICLLIENTFIAEDYKNKCELYYIFVSWIFLILFLISIIYFVILKLQSDKVKEFFNKKPDLRKNK